MADRSTAQELVRRRREAERQALERVDVELLDIGDMDGARLSQPAMQRLLGLVGRSSHGSQIAARERSLTDGVLTCLVQREPGLRTVVNSPEGALTLIDLRISIHPANHADRHGAPSP